MLGGGAAGGLGGDPGQQAGEDQLAVGPGVEVHVQGDQVDRGEADLGHRVAAVLAGQVDLAVVQVVQRGGAGQRLEPAGQALVGGGAGRGAHGGRDGGSEAGLDGRVCDGGHGGQD